MKKFLLSIFLLMMFSGIAQGAISEDKDIYVRQDVFDAKMEAFMSEIRIMNMELRRDMDKQFSELRSDMNKKFAEVRSDMDKQFAEVRSDIKALNEKVDGNFATLSARIDGTEKQIDHSHNFLYLIMVLLGTLIVMPFFQEWREKRKENRNSLFTLEEVKALKRLLEINSAQFAGK